MRECPAATAGRPSGLCCCPTAADMYSSCIRIQNAHIFDSAVLWEWKCLHRTLSEVASTCQLLTLTLTDMYYNYDILHTMRPSIIGLLTTYCYTFRTCVARRLGSQYLINSFWRLMDLTYEQLVIVSLLAIYPILCTIYYTIEILYF